jgi:hypothetical protein
MVLRSDGANIPWDAANDHPVDLEGFVGQTWVNDGSPAPAAYVAPPPPPVILTYLQFRALFTSAENAAIMGAAQGNAAVLDWLLQAVGAAQINLSDPNVKACLDALAAASLLTSAREMAILANEAPG